MPDGTITAERTRLERPAPPNQTLAEGRPPSRRRRLVRYVLMLGAALILVVGGVWYWLNGGRYIEPTMPTCRPTCLPSRPMYPASWARYRCARASRSRRATCCSSLDPLEFELAVDQAKAAAEQARLDLEGLKADYQRAAQQAAQQAQVHADQATFTRYADLVRTRAVPAAAI